MATCIVTVNGVMVQPDGSFQITYTAALNDPPRNWGGDFIPDTRNGVAQNLSNWKRKMVKDALGRGATLQESDIIVFGGPS